MFENFRREDPALEEAIASAYEDLKGFHAQDEDHKKALDQLTKLYALKNENFVQKLDPNKLAMVFGNLAVAVIVVKFEQTGIITSQVGKFLSKL